MSFEDDIRKVHDELNPKKHPLVDEDTAFRYLYLLERGLAHHLTKCNKSCEHEKMVKALADELALTESQADKVNKRISEIIVEINIDYSKFETLIEMDQRFEVLLKSRCDLRTKLLAVANTASFMSDVEKGIETARQQVKVMMGQCSRSSFKDKYYFEPRITQGYQTPKDEYTSKFSSELNAREAAVDQMYKWRTGLAAPVQEMHTHYCTQLDLSKNGACATILNSYRDILDKLQSTILNNYGISTIQAKISLSTQPLIALTRENSEIYLDGSEWAIDFYNNLCVEGYVKKKGFIFDDWRYLFSSEKIRNAQLKASSEKFGKIADFFFEDCFSKFTKFCTELSKQSIQKLDEVQQTAAKFTVERKKEIEIELTENENKITMQFEAVKNLLDELA